MATDYEKKYKEALERAKNLIALYPQDAPGYREVFPELAESEDERTRKWIVKFIDEQYPEAWKDKKNKMLAYLEKQKEQKPAECNEDTQLLAGDYAISHYEQGKTYSASEVHKMLADAFTAGKSYQKPAEWSEEDEKMLNDLIGVFSQNQIIHPDGYLKIDKCGNNERKVKEFVSFLKSLRPSWKPSEEQMKAMSYFVRKHQATANRATTKWPEFEAFKSLYNDLKKLM